MMLEGYLQEFTDEVALKVMNKKIAPIVQLDRTKAS